MPAATWRVKAAAGDGQGEGALGFRAGADAARAKNAFRRIEGEIRVAVVRAGGQVVGAGSIAHRPQPDLARHVLQLAIAVGGTGQAVERMVGDIQFHDVAAQLLQLRRLRPHPHALGRRGGARGRGAGAPLDLHQAQPAGAECLQRCRSRTGAGCGCPPERPRASARCPPAPRCRCRRSAAAPGGPMPTAGVPWSVSPLTPMTIPPSCDYRPHATTGLTRLPVDPDRNPPGNAAARSAPDRGQSRPARRASRPAW